MSRMAPENCSKQSYFYCGKKKCTIFQVDFLIYYSSPAPLFRPPPKRWSADYTHTGGGGFVLRWAWPRLGVYVIRLPKTCPQLHKTGSCSRVTGTFAFCVTAAHVRIDENFFSSFVSHKKKVRCRFYGSLVHIRERERERSAKTKQSLYVVG